MSNSMSSTSSNKGAYVDIFAQSLQNEYNPNLDVSKDSKLMIEIEESANLSTKVNPFIPSS